MPSESPSQDLCLPMAQQEIFREKTLTKKHQIVTLPMRLASLMRKKLQSIVK